MPLISLEKLVPEERIELSTYPLPRGCATTTLLRHPGAGEAPGAGAITHGWGQGKGGFAPIARFSPPFLFARKAEPIMSKSHARSPDRQERLAAALRANLKRRKAQTRALAQASGGADKADALGESDSAAEAWPDSRPIPAQKEG